MTSLRVQVLSIGETVVEVNDSGFLGTVPTLRTQLLSDDSMLQVCATACSSVQSLFARLTAFSGLALSLLSWLDV